MANGVNLSPLEGAKHIDSASMQMAASNNLVLTDFSSFRRLAGLESRVSHAGFYRAIAHALTRGVHTERALTGLAAKLAFAADHAHAARQFDIVGAVGQLLLSLPLSRPLESVGHYYQALTLNRATLGDTARAGALFEQAADGASLEYRARAMLALGANSFTAGDHKSAMSFYREVIRIVTGGRVFDPVTLCGARKMTAVIRGMLGDHRGAVGDLERMFPLARMAGSLRPHAYYDYLNTLAVELGELGSLEQARRASEIALASPFAPAYPEFHETFDEIRFKQRRASRSVMAAPQHIGETQRVRRYVGKTHQLMHFPVPECDNAAARDERSGGTLARVLNFQQWKTVLKRPSNPHPGKLAPEEGKEITTGEKLIRLMDLISQDGTDDEMIDRILDAVEQIVLSRRNENLD